MPKFWELRQKHRVKRKKTVAVYWIPNLMKWKIISELYFLSSISAKKTTSTRWRQHLRHAVEIAHLLASPEYATKSPATAALVATIKCMGRVATPTAAHIFRADPTPNTPISTPAAAVVRLRIPHRNPVALAVCLLTKALQEPSAYCVFFDSHNTLFQRPVPTRIDATAEEPNQQKGSRFCYLIS